jgi:tetratricopeptide (TPR) repeat protein
VQNGDPVRIPRASPRATLLLVVVWLGLLGVLAPRGAAQAALPAEAQTALRAAQAAAAEALATYEVHHPDQPLWREAYQRGEEARRLAPGRTEPLRFLAQVYGILGWTARTWSSWSEYIDLGGTLDARSRADAARAALTLGYQSYNVGALDRAQELLRAAYQLDPSDVTAASILGQTELALGDPAAAAPLLAQAVDAFPELETQLERAELGAAFGLRATDAYLAGRARFAAGATAAALSLYTAAYQEAPTFVEAIRGAATSAEALGRTGEALTLYRRVVAVAPNDARALAAIARIEAPPAPTEPPEPPEPVVAEPPEPQPEPEPEPEPEPVVAAVPEPPTPTPQPTPQPTPTPTPEPEPAPAPAPGPRLTGGPSIVLLDTTLTANEASAGGEGAFTFLEAPAATVGDLQGPYNYAEGTLYVEVTASEKPSTDPVLIQLCLVPNDLITVGPACSEAGRLRLVGTSAVRASQGVATLTGASQVAWAVGLSQLLLVLRDAAGRPLDSRYATDDAGAPLDVGTYYPMQLHVRAVLVPAGGTFAGWD